MLEEKFVIGCVPSLSRRSVFNGGAFFDIILNQLALVDLSNNGTGNSVVSSCAL